MNIGILSKRSKKAADFARSIVAWLKDKKVNVVCVGENIDNIEIPPMDAVVVVGGDGTLLYAARALKGRVIPIIGINMGGLGFLTEIAPEEAFAAIEDCIKRRCAVSERMMCDVELVRGGKSIRQDVVLNDAVINKGNLARMIELEALVNGDYLSRYRADGLIISTPTGSTAYVLSAGGPIITPTVQCMVLCPICPHTLTNRPIVVSPEAAVEIVVQSESDVFLTLDGQEGYPLHKDDRVILKKSGKKTYIVSSPKKNYFEILRTKLHWGER